MRRLLAIIVGSIPLMSVPAVAAGYAIKEFSAEAMAMAYAGAAAGGANAGYLPYNAAAAAGVSGLDMTASVIGILPGSSANYPVALTSAGTPTGGSATPRNFIRDALVPSFEVRYRLSPRLSAGLSVYAPWGLSTSYSTTWAGRYYAQSTKLVTANITPVVAYQVLPDLAIGGGPQIEYARGRTSSAIDTGTIGFGFGVPGAVPGGQDSYAELTGTDWAFGYVLGAIWHPDSAFSIGLSYRSMLSHKLKGPLSFQMDGAGVGNALKAATGVFLDTHQTTPINMPAVVSLGATYAMSDDWTVAVEFDWMQWSKFKQLTVTATNPAQPPDEILTRWKDSSFVSIGLEHSVSQNWKLRGGVAYDQSPVPNSTREPRIPDADRMWISAGVGYRVSAHTDVDLTLSHLFNRTSHVSLNPSMGGDALRGYLSGTTRSYVDVVGVQLNYRV
ncbi:MAG: outer membrane protein transport protein [Pseudomonadota bacterium]|nr:outer membrane protein transport protein [Pseudomonadota bacterium]